MITPSGLSNTFAGMPRTPYKAGISESQYFKSETCVQVRLSSAMAFNHLSLLLSREIPKIVKGLKGDPNKKLSDLRALVSSLSNDGMETKDVLYSDDTDKRRTDYEERVATKGVTYLSMGAEALDSTLYGYRNTDLITIGGRAGQGKTFLIVYLAILLNLSLIHI